MQYCLQSFYICILIRKYIFFTFLFWKMLDLPGRCKNSRVYMYLCVLYAASPVLWLASPTVCNDQNHKSGVGVAVLAEPHALFKSGFSSAAPVLLRTPLHIHFLLTTLPQSDSFWNFLRPWHFRWVLGSYFVAECPSVSECWLLIFSHDQIEFTCLQQEYHRSDVSFSASRFGATRSRYVSSLGVCWVSLL